MTDRNKRTENPEEPRRKLRMMRAQARKRLENLLGDFSEQTGSHFG